MQIIATASPLTLGLRTYVGPTPDMPVRADLNVHGFFVLEIPWAIPANVWHYTHDVPMSGCLARGPEEQLGRGAIIGLGPTE